MLDIFIDDERAEDSSGDKSITAQYFGACYYGKPIWLNEQLSSQLWKRLNSQHYRAPRAAVKDRKDKIPRSVFDVILKMARPKQLVNYITALAVHQLRHQNSW